MTDENRAVAEQIMDEVMAEHGIRPRYAAGRINGVTPEVGTLVGPNTFGELLVVTAVDERGAVLGYPTKDEIVAARTAQYPRSVTEVRLGLG